MLPRVGGFSLPGSGGRTLCTRPQGARVSEIRLSVPARADYVHVLRSVIASVAAKLDFSYDDIEDLRLAVDETCAYLLGLRDAPTVLTLLITPSSHTVDVLASVDGTEAVDRATGLQANMVWHLLG